MDESTYRSRNERNNSVAVFVSIFAVFSSHINSIEQRNLSHNALVYFNRGKMDFEYSNGKFALLDGDALLVNCGNGPAIDIKLVWDAPNPSNPINFQPSHLLPNQNATISTEALMGHLSIPYSDATYIDTHVDIEWIGIDRKKRSVRQRYIARRTYTATPSLTIEFGELVTEKSVFW